MSRDHDDDDRRFTVPDEGDARFANRLLGSAARYEATPGAEARVLAAVVGQRRPRLGALLLRPAVVVAVLVGATAVAGATLGRHAIARALHLEAPPSVAPPSPANHRATVAATAVTRAPVPVEEGPEAALVAQAMNALRHDHDPARAAALLDEYRARYPDGALSEEALVLAMEAATDRHDPAAAAALGNRYLQRYPAGRFAAVARAAAAR